MMEYSIDIDKRDDDILDDFYLVNDELISNVSDILNAEDGKQLKLILKKLHAADTADLIEQLSPSERLEVLRLLKGHIDPEILTYLDEDVRETLIESLSDKEIAALLDHLESDDALDVIEGLDEDRQRTLLKAIPSQDRALYEQSLAWPDQSAGRLMRREVVTIPGFWTVGQTVDYLRNPKTETPVFFYNIIVVGPSHKPVGVIGLAQLLRSARATPVAKIMNKDVTLIPVNMKQEDVAFLFRQYGYVDMPVVDESDRLVGAITVDDIVFVMEEEMNDNILKMGGVREDDFYADVMNTTKRRLSWLVVNLMTAILASIVIAVFDAEIKNVVALAILMPIVASMGGNAGTQTLTVAVRALATNELTTSNAMRIMYKEVLVGGMNGVIFAILGGILAYFWFANPFIGFIIGAAMIINMVAAGFFGIFIPVTLEKLGADPAVSSSVFLTTITDVIGFLSFLGIASLVLF